MVEWYLGHPPRSPYTRRMGWMERVRQREREFVVGRGRRFGASLGSFTVHPHHLEDFLVLFQDVALMLRVMHAPMPLGSVRTAFKWWHRENWAEKISMDLRLKVALIEIPAHLWLVSTAQEILGSSCSVLFIAQETKSKANLVPGLG